MEANPTIPPALRAILHSTARIFLWRFRAFPLYYISMQWKETIAALGLPVKAAFDLTLQERRFLLGILLLFCLGIGARTYHQRNARPGPYTPPTEHLP